MFIKLIRFFRGIVTLKITDNYPERFLYICQKKNIAILNMRHCEKNMYISIPYRKLKEVEKLAKSAHIKYCTVSKKGVPIYINAYKKRVGLIVGLICLLILPYILNLFILDINIVGNNVTDTRLLEEQLHDMGIFRGAFRKNIDTQTIERMLMINNEHISWSAVNLKGCTAEIKIRETTNAKEIMDTHTPCNIVAKKDGFIVSTEVYEGQPLVKSGESVQAGEILVSGITQDSNNKSRLLKSRAKIFAETEDDISIPIDIEQKKYICTGVMTHIDIYFFGKKVFSFGEIPNTDSKTLTFAKKLSVMGKPIPIEFVKNVYLCRENISEKIDFKKAEELANINIKNKEDEMKQYKKIIDRELSAEEVNDKFLFNVHYKFIENIAESREILK